MYFNRLLTHGNKKGLKDRKNKKKKHAFGFAYFQGAVKECVLKLKEKKNFTQRRQGEKESRQEINSENFINRKIF